MGALHNKILAVLMVTVSSVLAAGTHAQLPSQNWLRTYVFLDSTANESRARESKAYYDGMGREVLAVAGATSLPDAYTATRTDYAIHGPIARKWLPVPSDAEYVNKNAYASKSAAFYGAGERAFTEYTYSELLPTRLSKETIPGNFWAGHGQKYSQHKCALTGEYACRKILVKDSDGTLYADSIYAPGTLRVTETENPDGMRLLKFENRQEKTVMERRIAGSTVADTRYVYDRRGDLRYVISPEGAALLPQSGDVSSEITEQYAQCFSYDFRHRVIKSKLPGCGATEYVYDKFGKLLMSADALQQQRHEWTVTLYDWKMRPAVRGTMTVPGLNAGALRETFRDSTLTATFSPTENDIETGLLYSPDAALNGFTPFMAWYYDNYDFIIGPNSVCRTRYADRSDGFTATGLQTGMAQNSGDGTVIYTAQKFDGYGNVTLSGNWDCYLQSHRLTTTTEYDFMHQPVCVTHTLEMMTEATVTSTRTACFRTAYDDLGRVTGETLSVNGGAPITLGANTYDGIGRLQRQTLGSQNVDYEYDIQSHLTSIGSGIYNETVKYAVDSPTDSTSYIYVNATRDAWGHGAPSQPERNIEWRYRYDGLGRLVDARSTDGCMTETADIDLDAKVRGVTRRYLSSTIQDAVISYDGALPTSVRDGSAPYYVEAVGRFSAGDYAMAHDALGRLIADGTRGVTAITYTPWGDWPKHITMDNGDYTDNSYQPDGTLRRRIFNTKRIITVTTVNAKGDTIVRQRRQDVRTTHQYYGPWEVTSGAENSTRLHTAYGYYDYAAGAHRWYLRNRQGSVTAVVDGDGNVLQRSGVYPGGTPFSVDYNAEATPSLTAASDRLHIGNRWMSHSGLNWYDNTARMHDPLLMRFTSPDALAAKYPSLSPWAHCAGNPANLTDPDGNVIWFIPLIKAVIGAAIDAAAQITVNMAYGNSFNEAIDKIDWTGVASSAIIGAVSSPGMSKASKFVMPSAVVADAVVDIFTDGSVQTVFGFAGDRKPWLKVGMDAAAPFVAKYGLECPINSFTKAVETDLSSKAAATLNKETTASMRNAIKIANGETFKTTWGGVFDYTIGIGSGTIKAQFDEKEKNDDEEDHYVQPIDSKISIYFSRTN